MINYDSIADSSSSALKLSRDSAGSSSSSSDGSRTRTRPRVEVITEIENNSMTEEGQQQPEGTTAADRSVTSQLTIRHVTDMDSGNYTCAPSNAEPASTMVYVSEGKTKWIFHHFPSSSKHKVVSFVIRVTHYMKIALKTIQTESHVTWYRAKSHDCWIDKICTIATAAVEPCIGQLTI